MKYEKGKLYMYREGRNYTKLTFFLSLNKYKSFAETSVLDISLLKAIETKILPASKRKDEIKAVVVVCVCVRVCVGGRGFGSCV